MLELELEHIKAILTAPNLKKALKRCLADPSVKGKDIPTLTEEDLGEVWDDIVEIWQSASPWVEERDGYDWEGDEFPIGVLGVPGAYWISAQEFDDSGPFTTLQEAVEAMEAEYGELMIPPEGFDEDDEDEEEEEEEEA